MGEVLEYEEIEMNSHRSEDASPVAATTSSVSAAQISKQTGGCCGGHKKNNQQQNHGHHGHSHGHGHGHHGHSHHSHNDRSMHAGDMSMQDPLDSSEYQHEGVAISASSRQHRTINFEKLYKSQAEESLQQQKSRERRHAIITILLSIGVFVSCTFMKEECPYSSEAKCVSEFLVPRVSKWILLILFNGIAARYQLEFFISKLTKWPISLGAFAFTMYMFIFNDQRLDGMYYSGATNMLSLISFVAFFILFRVASGWKTCMMSNPSVCTGISAILFIIVASFVYVKVFKNSCKYWEDTIHVDYPIDNSISGMCKVQVPDICTDSLTHTWQDITAFFVPAQCLLVSSGELTSPFIKGDLTPSFAALPLVQKTDNAKILSQSEDVLEKIEHFSTLKAAREAGKEIVLDEAKMHYDVSVIYNEKLAEKSKEIEAELLQADSESLAKNVLTIFLTGASRMSMHLKLPKTLAWFKKNAAERHTSEFYRYNAIDISSDVQKRDAKVAAVFEQYKNAGFITGTTADVCKGVSSSVDHAGVAFSCDPNYSDVNSEKTLSTGSKSFVKRCLYGEEISSIMFSYTKSFFAAYKENKKAFQMEFSFEDDLSGEVIAHLDEPLADFLEENALLFKDTVIILHSENGKHHRGIVDYQSKRQQARIENNLPALFVSLPQEYDGDIAAIKSNQQSLVTPDNLHHFVQHLIRGDVYESKDLSLFNPLNKQLQCVQMNIPDSNCSCK